MDFTVKLVIVVAIMVFHRQVAESAFSKYKLVHVDPEHWKPVETIEGKR